MTHRSIPIRPQGTRSAAGLLPAAALACLLAPVGVTQSTHEGFLFVGSQRNSVYLGSGGLHLANPTDPTDARSVSGLPADITGAAASAAAAGATFVAFDPRLQMAVSGGHGSSSSGWMRIHRWVVVDGQAISAGSWDIARIKTDTGHGMADAAYVFPRRFVFTFDPASAGRSGDVMENQTLGVLDTSIASGQPGAVTALPVQPTPPGYASAVAFDPGSRRVYVAYNDPATGTFDIIWRPLDVPGGATHVAQNQAGTVVDMDLGHGHSLILATDHGSDAIQHLDLSTGALAPIPVPSARASAVAVERISGDIYYVEDNGPTLWTALPPRVMRIVRSGPVLPLSQGPIGGWGDVTGLAVNEAMVSLRDGSAGAAEYTFRIDPNPSGAPRTGSPFFSLFLESSGSSPLLAQCFFSSSARFTPRVIQGGLVWIDPAQVFYSRMAPGGGPMVFAAPIPNAPGLIGTRLSAQAMVLESNLNIATSDALSITIQP